jgi:7,8-dihydroneopterin aldolase/epimerase/oxygenase
MNSLLSLRGILLHLHIGYSDQERLLPQPIILDLELRFPEPPKACVSDQLTDTFCYADLISLLEKKLENQSFHLLEHLAQWIYTLVKTSLRDQVKITVHITKYPPILSLSQGVRFSYGDD